MYMFGDNYVLLLMGEYVSTQTLVIHVLLLSHSECTTAPMND